MICFVKFTTIAKEHVHKRSSSPSLLLREVLMWTVRQLGPAEASRQQQQQQKGQSLTSLVHRTELQPNTRKPQLWKGRCAFLICFLSLKNLEKKRARNTPLNLNEIQKKNKKKNNPILLITATHTRSAAPRKTTSAPTNINRYILFRKKKIELWAAFCHQEVTS